MVTSSKSRPTRLVEVNALSLYFDAQTAFRALKAWYHASLSFGAEIPFDFIVCARSFWTSSGISMPMMSSRQVLNAFVSPFLASFTDFSNWEAISELIGDEIAASKLPNGNAIEEGREIHSGSFPRRLAKFLDFAPTTPFSKLSIPMDHFLHHVGFATERFFFALASSEADSEEATAEESTSSQETAPAAFVVMVIYFSFSSSSVSNGSASWQAPNKAFIFLHRTDKCDNTSGASPDRIPTTPRGTSSSPVTLDANNIVGSL
mmetsp:Transcript_1500/g.3097  ORF Transcript_1500/g.3097 Transcript_1500/m.3097 type:complete len:262 (+) Transcript_1500:1801-2586(+)